MSVVRSALNVAALGAATLALTLSLAVPMARKATAQEASITIRSGPAYGYGYYDRDDRPDYGARYYVDDEPVASERTYTYDRDNLRTDRRVRRFIERQRNERGGGEN